MVISSLACATTPSGSYEHVDGRSISDVVVSQGAAVFKILGGTQEVHIVRRGSPLFSQDFLQ